MRANGGGVVTGEAVLLGDAGALSALVSEATGALALGAVRVPEPTLEGTGAMSPVAFRDGVHALVKRTRLAIVSVRPRPRVARCSDIGAIRAETTSSIKTKTGRIDAPQRTNSTKTTSPRMIR